MTEGIVQKVFDKYAKILISSPTPEVMKNVDKILWQCRQELVGQIKDFLIYKRSGFDIYKNEYHHASVVAYNNILSELIGDEKE